VDSALCAADGGRVSRWAFCVTDTRRRATVAGNFAARVKLFAAGDFIAELTQHIPRAAAPPQGMQLIRRYGLYSSRGRGVWHSKAYLVPLALAGWEQSPQPTQASEQGALSSPESRAAWARLIAKVYEVDP
jgi:hypothetical protein